MQEFVRRQIPVHRRNLRQIAQLALGFLRAVEDVNAIDGNLAFRGGKIATDHLHCGGFSRSVGSEKAQYFSPLQCETDIIDSAVAGEKTVKLFNLNQAGHEWVLGGGRCCDLVKFRTSFPIAIV